MEGQSALFTLISESKILFYCVVNHFFCSQNVVFWKDPMQLDTISLFNDRSVSPLLLPVSLTNCACQWPCCLAFQKKSVLLSYSLDSKAIFIKYYLTWGKHSTALPGSMKSKLQAFLPRLSTMWVKIRRKVSFWWLLPPLWAGEGTVKQVFLQEDSRSW